jgi:hypothetical protein
MAIKSDAKQYIKKTHNFFPAFRRQKIRKKIMGRKAESSRNNPST